MTQEECSKKKVEMFYCFVDLEKAYDSVNRKALWIVLSRFGLPEILIGNIKAFHDGMRGRIKLPGSKYTKYFNIVNGLRQGCVLSPMLFNIYLAAVQKAMETKDEGKLLRNAVKIRYNLEQGLPVGPREGKGRKTNTPEMELHSLWGMLYADDLAVVAKSIRELQELINMLNRSFTDFGLTISISKTETMAHDIRKKNETTEVEGVNITINGQLLKQKKSFVYLGGETSADGTCKREIKRRCALAWAAFENLRKKVFTNKAMSRDTKMKMYNTFVKPILTYGAETWTILEDSARLLRRTHRTQLLWMLPMGRVRRYRAGQQRLSYQKILRMTRSRDIESQIRYRRIKRVGEIIRMEDNRLPKILLFGDLDLQGKPGGGNRKTWKRMIEEDFEYIGVQCAPTDPPGPPGLNESPFVPYWQMPLRPDWDNFLSKVERRSFCRWQKDAFRKSSAFKNHWNQIAVEPQTA